jgi:hypothetical protein
MSIKQHVDAMHAMRQSGATWDAISKHFGTHREHTRSTVLMFYPDTIRSVQVRIPPPKETQFVRVSVDVERAISLRKAGMSFLEIGRVLGVSQTTIASRLAEAGLHTGKEAAKRAYGKPRNIRMTDAEYEVYCRRGGIAWLREMLTKA